MKETKEANPSVLVFIVTGNGGEEVDVETLSNGARDYVNKAYGKNVLPAPVAPALAGAIPSTVTLRQFHKIQQAVRFINDNYRTDIRLGAAAREADMSLAHFSRIFKKVMGLSYQEYLNNRRIAKAKSLLRSSSRSISEIAVSLGFADPTGFGRIFKKLTGQTASAYRRLGQK